MFWLSKTEVLYLSALAWENIVFLPELFRNLDLESLLTRTSHLAFLRPVHNSADYLPLNFGLRWRLLLLLLSALSHQLASESFNIRIDGFISVLALICACLLAHSQKWLALLLLFWLDAKLIEDLIDWQKSLVVSLVLEAALHSLFAWWRWRYEFAAWTWLSQQSVL